jgi:hypothetical protein
LKKISLYLLFALSLLSNECFVQLLKAPKLIAHYLDHQQRDTAIGLFQFLSMHYWGEDINDNDDQQDRQLPFKSIDHSFTQSIFYPPTKVVALEFSRSLSQCPYPSQQQQDLPIGSLSGLLKPPQYVQSA